MSVIKLTKENFDAEIIGSEKTVLVDFWSAGCAPCLLFGITIERVAREYPDLKVCKVNVDQEKELRSRFNIQNIPTLLVIKNGKITDRALGIRTKKQIMEILAPKKDDSLVETVARYIEENYIDDSYTGSICYDDVCVLREEIFDYKTSPVEDDMSRIVPPTAAKKSMCAPISNEDFITQGIGSTLEDNASDASFTVNLEEIMKELDAGFSETLLHLIDLTGKKDSEVYKKANIDRKLFSKIRNNMDYKPSKTTALAFAIALELSLDETKDLIARAGYALTHSSKFDIIVEYFIINRRYNILELNEMLYEFDQPLIGT